MDSRLKIVFMGTSEFAVPSLLALAGSRHNAVLVITQPDKKRGRGKHLLPTPVKEAARENNLPIMQPENINSNEAVSEIKKLEPDVVVVVAYGQILKEKILAIPEYGCINVHASLLPKLRGAAPINRAILNGHTKSGITTMLMDEGVDTGDILQKSESDIDDEINAIALMEKLSEIGGAALIRTLDLIDNKKPTGTKQNDDEATYAPVLTKADGLIDFAGKNAKQIHDMVRGLLPWPSAHTFLNSKSIRILKTSYDLSEETDSAPGTIVMVTKESFFVAASKGVLEVISLQSQNKRAMSAKDFINGYRLKAGTKFSTKEF